MAESQTLQGSATALAGEESTFEQTVEIQDKGPCLKHIKVTVPREIIDRMLDAKLEDLRRHAAIPGFRPGHAPAALVRRYLGEQAWEEIRPTLLLASLEDLMKKYSLNPISAPNFDPTKLKIPKEGPLVYELDLEVWPEFETPPYKGLRLKRPVFPITEELLHQFMNGYFRRIAGRFEPKETAEQGDILVGTVTITRDGVRVAEFPQVRLECQHELQFKDGIVRNFLEIVAGARAGDTREFTVELQSGTEPAGSAPATAQARLVISAIYRFHPAESLEAAAEALGLESVHALEEMARNVLQRRVESFQKFFLREQILMGWVKVLKLDLPPNLLYQVHLRHLRSRVEELLQAGYSAEEINRHSELLLRGALSMAVSDLVSRIVTRKIAELEKLEVTDEEIDQAIEQIAEELDETPRRVRSRLERENRLEDLVLSLLQNKVYSHILSQADIEDFPVTDFSAEDLLDMDRREGLMSRLFQNIFGETPASQQRIIIPPTPETTEGTPTGSAGISATPSATEEQSIPSST
ncbi:MAG: trigger factor [Gemmatales bacterium]|nr:trigger factor [Gemmatales bacterium]MDW7993392.1 trigger factor [Gemmatales bacterium]